jgi:hypothetical protein
VLITIDLGASQGKEGPNFVGVAADSRHAEVVRLQLESDVKMGKIEGRVYNRPEQVMCQIYASDSITYNHQNMLRLWAAD